MNVELIGEINLYLALGIEIILAFILGGLIGLDREKNMKAAGIRTNILICVGSTCYTAVSLLNTPMGIGSVDPNRVAAQVVSGIGFLGAGAIIQSKGTVLGLTTAATIWVVAAIGVALGSGHLFIATMLTATILFVLKLLKPIHKLLHLRKDFYLEIESKRPVKNIVKSILANELDCTINSMFEKIEDEKSDLRSLRMNITIHPKRMQMIAEDIRDLGQVTKVNYYIEDFAEPAASASQPSSIESNPN